MSKKDQAQAATALRTARCATVMAMMLALGLTSVGPVNAATATAAEKAAKPAATAAKPAAKPGAKTAAAVPDPGYRIAPIPAWVQDPPPASGTAPAAPTPPLPPGLGSLGAQAAAPSGLPSTAATAPSTAKARRDLLIDNQTLLTGKVPVQFMRSQRQALDSSTLREVSELQILFNPDYQRVVIHQVAVLRDGQRQDRTKGLRVEIMRREQQLEQQMLTGLRTALVMLNDVRVGDIVEASYSIEGENPIFEGRFAELYQVAGDAPIDRVFLRVEAPASRPLQTRAIGGDIKVDRQEQNGRQILTVFRERVPAVLEEPGTPPWFKVYPALHVSEYQSWDEVDRWAQGLFQQETPTGELAQRIADWKAKNLAPEALVAEVLRFVQDDVRYFSLSLGDSSHRPKAASRTLAERLGDCKDKVQLLNTLLTGLGIEAHPALVSTFRNRGVKDYLPGHDQFDHVISRVTIGDQIYFLDPTMTGQGLDLRRRGYYPYGQALVVGAGVGLQPVTLPSFALDALEFRQQWDLSDLKKTPRLDATMVARGLSAERWRAYVAAAGLERLGESFGGLYVRAYPGLKPAAPAELKDSRETNELELVLHFTHASPGPVSNGSIVMELPMFELADMLSAPNEARRRTPYMVDQPALAEEHITVIGPYPMALEPPAPKQITSPQFLFSVKTEAAGPRLAIHGRYERRADEVLPADLDGYRERVSRGRLMAGTRAGFTLVDKLAATDKISEVIKRTERYGNKKDALVGIVFLKEFVRVRDSLLLDSLDPTGQMAQKVLAERAQAYNMLGEPALGLKDADAALAINGKDEEALEARGVALVGLGRLEEAAEAFRQQASVSTSGNTGTWLALTQYQLGRYDDAVRSLRDSVDASSGEQRYFGLLWLSLASERQTAGQGVQVLQEEARKADSSVWGGQLVRYLAGQIDRNQLLKSAREKPEQERLRLAEAYYYIGQQLDAQGKRGEALSWFEKVVGTQAVPYREYTFAQLELKRGR